MSWGKLSAIAGAREYQTPGSSGEIRDCEHGRVEIVEGDC